MSTIDPLILDLLEWLGPNGRAYAEVMDAWRTSCPRLPIWEEANERGFIEQRAKPGEGAWVSVSPLGEKHLSACRPQSPQRA